MERLRNIWDRIAHNWTTSGTAIIAAGVIVAGWFGVEVTSATVLTVVIGVQALVLLFAKDK